MEKWIERLLYLTAADVWLEQKLSRRTKKIYYKFFLTHWQIALATWNQGIVKLQLPWPRHYRGLEKIMRKEIYKDDRDHVVYKGKTYCLRIPEIRKDKI